MNDLLIALLIIGAYFVCDMLVDWIRVIACFIGHQCCTDETSMLKDTCIRDDSIAIAPSVINWPDGPVVIQCTDPSEIHVMSYESDRPIRTYYECCEGHAEKPEHAPLCEARLRYDEEDDEEYWPEV